MSSRSRRQFMTESLLTSAAAVAATYAAQSGNAYAQQATDKAPEKVSPNDLISVAVIGANSRGGNHIEAFAKAKDTIITHICDTDEQVGYKRCEDAAKLQGGKKPEWVRDIRKLLEDKSIDAVSVATPNHWHALATIWAVQAGKDVYCEKPVSHNVSEGRRAVQVAAKYGKIVQTGTQSRSNAGIRDAVEFIHKGGIGDVRLVRGLCYKPRGSIGPKGNYEVPAYIDYDLWSGPAEILPVTRKQFHYDWHWQWPYGNGDLGNQGIHQMDVSRWVLNAPQLSDHVFSVGGRLGYEDAGETANTQSIIHQFGEKRIIFEVRGLKTDPYKGAAVGLVAYGTKGYVVFPNYYTLAVVYDTEGNKIKEFKGGNDQIHYENFISAVKSRNPDELAAPILDGHLSSGLCHTGNISYRLGQKSDLGEVNSFVEGLTRVEEIQETLDRMTAHLKENKVDLKATPLTFGQLLHMDPSTERFLQNDAANAMLTRDYRSGFVVPTEANI
jgi:predicted dehydrogenase